MPFPGPSLTRPPAADMKTTESVLVLALAVGSLMAACRREQPHNESATNVAPIHRKPAVLPGDFPTNRVLSLDGMSSFVFVPDSPSLQSLTNGLTLELWFNATSFYRGPGEVNSLLRKNIEPGRQAYFLRFRSMGRNPVAEFCFGNQILQGRYDFRTNTWCHLAGTYDGQVMTILAQGEIIATEHFSEPIRLDDSDLVIGKGDPSFSYGEYFHGDVDEVRIWNVARSPEQIQASMSARLTGKEPGLVAYWTFDDGGVKDLTGHGNNGVLQGQSKIVPVPSGP